jgi:hypothetical protein
MKKVKYTAGLVELLRWGGCGSGNGLIFNLKSFGLRVVGCWVRNGYEAPGCMFPGFRGGWKCRSQPTAWAFGKAGFAYLQTTNRGQRYDKI